VFHPGLRTEIEGIENSGREQATERWRKFNKVCSSPNIMGHVKDEACNMHGMDKKQVFRTTSKQG
jgi:hypothetical protein